MSPQAGGIVSSGTSAHGSAGSRRPISGTIRLLFMKEALRICPPLYRSADFSNV
jgi:hypothetical protein